MSTGCVTAFAAKLLHAKNRATRFSSAELKEKEK
jgi:hypothetical protein